ncbi:ribonucleotide-diphosphate reductase subunit beta [Xanthomonas phage DES1]|nr:ribonucleotide-diphosphate reductase subunit beta [Xanthomonas phage DES1]
MRNLLTPKSTYVVEYEEAVKMADEQLSIFWTPTEIKLEKDKHDILTNLTEAEKHGVITTLKLFTQYEQIVGEEYWCRVFATFQKPADIQRMANCFSFFELNVHAPFYAQINEILGLANEEFYQEYKQDRVLAERIGMLEQHAQTSDIPKFLMTLAFAEGVILYSNFAFLKHFQSQGKNKIPNIVRGINMSARDEALHSMASSWLFKTFLQENNISLGDYYDVLLELSDIVREHEHKIVDMIFAKGSIEGITEKQMKNFIDSRINLVSRNLGYDNLYDVSYNPIASHFYDGINNYIMNDFFAGQGREYTRNWAEGELSW